MKNIFFTITTSILLLCSCNSEEDAFEEFSKFNNCFNEMNLDSVDIVTNLIGVWELDRSFCFSSGQSDRFSGTTVEFRSNQNLVLNQNGQFLETTTWHLNHSELTTRITLGEWFTEIAGSFHMCEDQILFSSTIVDGCDNYFKKVE